MVGEGSVGNMSDIWSSYGEILILGHQIADLQACLREENLYHSRLTQLFLEVGNQVFPVSGE